MVGVPHLHAPDRSLADFQLDVRIANKHIQNTNPLGAQTMRKSLLAGAIGITLLCQATVMAQQTPRKPRIADTIKANVYADNSFKLYINGELVTVDSIAFVPHNVVSVDVLPAYPMTIAVMGIDNADPKTGMEYANTNIGDGGFILKLGDGTVTNATWKAKKFSWGPIDGDVKNPRVENIPLPKNWYAVDFDDSQWPNAKEFTEEEVGPKEPFFEHDFKGAKFIWSDDVKLDNLVLFRTVVKSPLDGKDRPDFRGLTDVVPQRGGGRRGGGGNRGQRGPNRSN
jgi:hypothetical protein